MHPKYSAFNLSALRMSYQLSQSQLAKYVGVSTNTICSIERYHFMPSLTLAYKLAQFFNVSIDELFFD